MWAYKGDVNLASGENWKKLSPTEASFYADIDEQILNVNKSCWQ